MGAYVRENLGKGYILDEVRVRKIVDIIREKFKDCPVSFKIYRGDSSFYETESIDDLVKEDNQGWLSIKGMEITCRDKSKVIFFELAFRHFVSIRIEGQDRDFIFVLFTDLNSYLKDQVLKKSYFFSDSSSFFGVAFLSFGLSFLFLFADVYTSFISALRYEEFSKELIENGSIDEKLNFLIEGRSKVVGFRWFYVALGFIILPLLFMSGSPLQKFLNRKFPDKLFLFGSKKEEYEKRQELISKIFWGVGVSLVVGVAASLFAWVLTT